MSEQPTLTPTAALRLIAGEHYSSAQYARELARNVLAKMSPAAALELGTVKPTAEPVDLTEHELELASIALIAVLRLTQPLRVWDEADNAAARRLLNRLGSELMRRRDSEVQTLEAAATCAECGRRGGSHELDCDLRPMED